MSLGIQEPPVERDHTVIAVEQVEILEGLCYKEALLDIILGGIGIVDILYASVATAFYATMPLQCLQEFGHKINND